LKTSVSNEAVQQVRDQISIQGVDLREIGWQISQGLSAGEADALLSTRLADLAPEKLGTRELPYPSFEMVMNQKFQNELDYYKQTHEYLCNRARGMTMRGPETSYGYSYGQSAYSPTEMGEPSYALRASKQTPEGYSEQARHDLFHPGVLAVIPASHGWDPEATERYRKQLRLEKKAAKENLDYRQAASPNSKQGLKRVS
jgi:hypothetical protein